MHSLSDTVFREKKKRISFRLKRVICYENLGSRMEGSGLWVDLGKGLKMVADRIVPRHHCKQTNAKLPIVMVLLVKD